MKKVNLSKGSNKRPDSQNQVLKCLRLSVITINFNNKKGLEKTIGSVIEQSYKEIEYIIIDGASTDGSVKVIKENSPGISYWLSDADTGIYNAMNKGIAKATGEYLIFLNSGDTFIDANVLKRISEYNLVADIVYGNLVVCENERQWIKEYPNQLSFKFFYKDTLPHPCSLIRKVLFDKYGLYNENNKIVSDWEFFMISIMKHNCSYQHLNVPIARFVTDGISSNVANHALIAEEKKAVLLKHFPNFIVDYKELFDLKQQVQTLQNSRALKLAKRFRAILKK